MPRQAANGKVGLRKVRRGNGSDDKRPTVRRTTLPGGLRVVTEYIPSVRSASVGVWVGVGSRDEGPSVAGAAHFLEHLLFKATPTRTAVEIAQAVDAVGGELNAFTAKEHTCYYAHVLDTDLDAGGRPGGRRGAARVVRGRRRRARTRRGARRDRHARRRSRGHARRRVPLGAVRRPPGRAPGDRQRRVGLGDDAVAAAFVPRAPLHARPDGGRGRGQRRPRRGGRAGARAFRQAPGARPRRGRAPQGHRPGDRRAGPRGGQPGRRADAHVARGAGARPALGAAVGVVGAEHRARRRAEFAAVPTDSRNARAGLLGVFDGGHVLRHRCAVGLCRVPAGAVRRGGQGDHRRARGGGPRRDHRSPSAGSPRVRCAAGWCSVWRTPARG